MWKAGRLRELSPHSSLLVDGVKGRNNSVEEWKVVVVCENITFAVSLTESRFASSQITFPEETITNDTFPLLLSPC